MDPDANLKRQLELSKEVLRRARAGGAIPTHVSVELAELVESLDDWLMTGGFLPDKWKRGE